MTVPESDGGNLGFVRMSIHELSLTSSSCGFQKRNLILRKTHSLDVKACQLCQSYSLLSKFV